MKPPGDLHYGLPWFDGKLIYRSGDEAAPIAIAVTEADAAAIVTALAAVEPRVACLRVRDGFRPGPSGSMFCEAPAAAIMLAPSGAGGPRCIEHIAEATGSQVVPLDYHPDTWSAVRRLLVSWDLPAGETRDAWVDQCVGDLRAMRARFVSRFRPDEMPASTVEELHDRLISADHTARVATDTAEELRRQRDEARADAERLRAELEALRPKPAPEKPWRKSDRPCRHCGAMAVEWQEFDDGSCDAHVRCNGCKRRWSEDGCDS